MKLHKYIAAVIFMGLGTVMSQSQDTIPEVEALLQKMTLEEKIGQLNLLTPGGGVATGSVVSDDVEGKIKAGEVGGIFGVTGPNKVRKAQEIAVNSSRLKIPLLIGSDVIHGYKTTFPIPLGSASSWDMDLIKQAAQISAKESTADGINWNFSPMVDIARDPRWGRIAEGADEDPYLGSAITYAKGANITNDTVMAKNVNVFGPKIEIDERSPESLLNEALEVAKASDVVVAVVGEASEMTGEAASRTDISIPDSQKKLIQALAKTGKPVVLVLMSGRPLTIEEEYELPVSILQVWYPGVEAGNAIADVVFGGYNPSGKLTATWPRNVGQIPIYYSMKNTGRPTESEEFQKFKSNYLDTPNSPLFPFGYGLSYTEFEYSDLRLNKSEIDADEAMTVTVNLKNIGNYDGGEVVQLYLRDVVRSITPPMRQLKGFKKVFLKKGETQTVTLELKPEDLKFYNSGLEFVAEPGEFEVFVGTDSNADLKTDFTLK